MTTATYDAADTPEIESLDQLTAYLAAGCKPKDKWRIGTEHEKFPFCAVDHTPIPYEGERSIKALLQGMQVKLGWEPIIDEGNIIGLFEPNGMGAISLEPGGQFELSGAPLATIHETCRESNRHLAQLREVSEPMGMGFLGIFQVRDRVAFDAVCTALQQDEFGFVFDCAEL